MGRLRKIVGPKAGRRIAKSDPSRTIQSNIINYGKKTAEGDYLTPGSTIRNWSSPHDRTPVISSVRVCNKQQELIQLLFCIYYLKVVWFNFGNPRWLADKNPSGYVKENVDNFALQNSLGQNSPFEQLCICGQGESGILDTITIPVPAWTVTVLNRTSRPSILRRLILYRNRNLNNSYWNTYSFCIDRWSFNRYWIYRVVKYIYQL